MGFSRENMYVWKEVYYKNYLMHLWRLRVPTICFYKLDQDSWWCSSGWVWRPEKRGSWWPENRGASGISPGLSPKTQEPGAQMSKGGDGGCLHSGGKSSSQGPWGLGGPSALVRVMSVLGVQGQVRISSGATSWTHPDMECYWLSGNPLAGQVDIPDAPYIPACLLYQQLWYEQTEFL